MDPDILADLIRQTNLTPDDDDEEEALYHEYDDVDIEYVLSAYRDEVEAKPREMILDTLWAPRVMTSLTGCKVFCLGSRYGSGQMFLVPCGESANGEVETVTLYAWTSQGLMIDALGRMPGFRSLPVVTIDGEFIWQARGKRLGELLGNEAWGPRVNLVINPGSSLLYGE